METIQMLKTLCQAAGVAGAESKSDISSATVKTSTVKSYYSNHIPGKQNKSIVYRMFMKAAISTVESLNRPAL